MQNRQSTRFSPPEHPTGYNLGMSQDFHTTRWSVILSAGDRDEPSGREALAQLCQDYWHPVYVFIRRSGKSADEARDLTQEYFTRMIEREYLSDVKQNLGKFRSFLLTSVKHFLSNYRRDAAAGKRGGGVAPLELDSKDAEQWIRRVPVDDRTPESAYEYRWAVDGARSSPSPSRRRTARPG